MSYKMYLKGLRRFLIRRWIGVLLATLAVTLFLLCEERSGLGRGLGEAQVFDSARDGDSEAVKAAVQQNPSLVSETDDRGNTLLDWANTGEMAEFLLAHHADLNARNIGKLTPLHCAVIGGHKDVVKVLLDHKADVNAKDEYGDTPLHDAVIAGRNEAPPDDSVQILLDYHADINAKGQFGDTPLHLAAGVDRKTTVEVLLAGNANINAKDDNGLTPLHDAAAAGHADMVERLLAKGADINARDNSGKTPLDSAAVPPVGSFAMDAATVAGRENVVKILLSHKAGYGVFAAAATGDVATVKAMVARDPSLVSAKDSDHKTLLHYAASLQQKDMAELLIAAKADVAAKDSQGYTPLHVAAEAGRPDIAALLLVNKADVNDKANGNVTPLHLAADMGNDHADVVELLLAHGADVNAKATNGDTPLQVAARNGRVANLLMQHGGHY